MTEREIAEKSIKGDNAARKELYERFAGRLFAVCLRYARDREEAEDLLHDGFLKAYTSMSRFTWRGEGSLYAWLYRIFTNHAIKMISMRLPVSDVEPEEMEMPEEEEDTEGIPMEMIHQWIEQLPDGYRLVLNLFLVEGWSHKQIAAYLGIKENSSASQYLRARALLRKKIIAYRCQHL